MNARIALAVCCAALVGGCNVDQLTEAAANPKLSTAISAKYGKTFAELKITGVEAYPDVPSMKVFASTMPEGALSSGYDCQRSIVVLSGKDGELRVFAGFNPNREHFDIVLDDVDRCVKVAVNQVKAQKAIMSSWQ